jgi:hypothetical protein
LDVNAPAVLLIFCNPYYLFKLRSIRQKQSISEKIDFKKNQEDLQVASSFSKV